MTQKPFEVISVDKITVSCDGGGGPLGHPRVFLHVSEETGDVMCPYCSRLYVNRTLKKAAS